MGKPELLKAVCRSDSVLCSYVKRTSETTGEKLVWHSSNAEEKMEVN